ncbi:HepT-like ribonuclease domain-containing protein [Caldicellulosiruptor changbaiensis]|nr:HepT-like ribonuclease domain-containing protein [Caldicellulosiruptor changbaiensis]
MVHLYFEVDNLALYDILQSNLSDFDKFIDEIT